MDFRQKTLLTKWVFSYLWLNMTISILSLLALLAMRTIGLYACHYFHCFPESIEPD